MKLDYATLISPYPLILNKIGSIKSPTLKEIWNPKITYNTYKLYLSLLSSTPKSYCEIINPTKNEWYQTLTDEEKSALTMMHIISVDKELQYQYCKVFDFFFDENIIWDNYNKGFITYIDTDDKGQVIPLGFIHCGIWNELCDMILQRCGVNSDNKPEKLKFKSKLAQEVWELTHSKEKKEKEDKNLELGNIISSVAAKDESLNMINIWDLTVYQLYDQFQRCRENTYFDIKSMSVAAWGDEKNKFDGTGWYKNIHEN